jgi:hypothetical protein
MDKSIDYSLEEVTLVLKRKLCMRVCIWKYEYWLFING